MRHRRCKGLLLVSAGSAVLLAAAIRESPATYVLRREGLELHAEASSESLVNAVIPYGAKVEVGAATGEQEIAIDGIPGRFREARHGRTSGYVFDGYLGTVPGPEPKMKPADYAIELRKLSPSILYEKIDRDWGGYVQVEEAVVLPTTDMREAFVVARLLFETSPGIPYPPPSTQAESTYENPGKASHLWSDELTVKRDPSGKVLEMGFYVRGEGGGVTVTIEPHEEGIRLSQTAIGD